jgi:hypothetical protein
MWKTTIKAFILCLLTLQVAFGQKAESIVIDYENGKVNIHYDLVECQDGVPYEIYVYSSHDNYQKPLVHVTGDAGKNVYGGFGKLIYWDAQKELGHFKGEIQVSIKGRPYVPFVQFSNITDGLALKRGNTFPIKWQTSEAVDKVKLELYKGDFQIRETITIENSGSYNWVVPKDLKPGNDYRLHIESPKDLTREEFSKTFKIKRKVPTVLKIIPAAVLAGGVIYLLNQKESAQTGGIPDPPSIE